MSSLKNATSVLLCGSALLLALSTGPVSAHADLLRSVPAVDAKVESAPAELRLSFSELVEIAFTKVKVTTADGRALETEPPALDPDEGRTVVVRLKSTAAEGMITVDWSVVSADGHKRSGSYKFEVTR